MQCKHEPHKRSRILPGLLLACFLCLAFFGWGCWRELRQQHLNTDLLAAVDRSDTSAALSLLQQGADPNVSYSTDKRSFWKQIVDILARKHSPSVFTPPPLIRMLRWRTNEWGEESPPPRNMALVHALIEHGAYLETRDADDKTPLALAAWTGDKDCIRLLMRLGAHSETRDCMEDTPLMLAVLGNNVSIVQFMVGQHVNVNARNESGYSALDFAEMNPSRKMETILKKAGARR